MLFRSRVPKDAEDQIEAAMGAAKAIKDVHGTAYTVGGHKHSILSSAEPIIVDWTAMRDALQVCAHALNYLSWTNS